LCNARTFLEKWAQEMVHGEERFMDKHLRQKDKQAEVARTPKRRKDARTEARNAAKARRGANTEEEQV
jgi:hypothetical protein